MKEKRRSQRINCLGTGWLQLGEGQYFCRLENISLHGAMVGLKETPASPIRQGERCSLRLYLDAEGEQYRDFSIRVIRLESGMAGLEFIGLDDASKDVVETVMRKRERLVEGASGLIGLAREVAGLRGVELTDLHFDKGELSPDREIHTLRFFAGEQRAAIHLHGADIETFHARDDAAPAHREIRKAIDRLLSRPS